jgi:VWFA-related protein
LRVAIRTSFAACIFGFLAILCSAGSETRKPAGGSVPTIKTTTNEVILDFVVRDKHGHIVRDIQPNEVSVFDDGVRQTIRSFVNVGAERSAGPEASRRTAPAPQGATNAAPEPATRVRSAHELTFVSVVFGDIAPANRTLARDGVLTFVRGGLPAGTYVSIYQLGLHLAIVQPYTTDGALIADAINQTGKGITGGATPNAILQNPRVATNALAAGGMPFDANTSAKVVKDPQFVAGTSGYDASMGLSVGLDTQAALVARLRFTDNLGTGMATIDALRELVRSQGKLPGRKIVLYLSDGLTLPGSRPDAYKDLINLAAHAGVTFYTFNTKGLATESPGAASSNQLEGVMADGRALPEGGRNQNMWEDIDRLSVANTQLALLSLADATGGVGTADANNIKQPMRNVLDDIRYHYEISYEPPISKYDGKFRKIEVKIARSGMRVQARKGYYAVPAANVASTVSSASLALAALDASPLPKPFEYEAALMQVGGSGAATDCAVMFDIPLRGLKADKDPQSKKLGVRVMAVALVRDGAGNVVGRVAQEFSHQVTGSDSGALASERIFYAAPVRLPSGHYRVDTAVVDEQARAASAFRFAAFIRAPAGLWLGPVLAVRRDEALHGPERPENPFEVKNRVVTLTLDSQLPAAKPVVLYDLVHPDMAHPQGSVSVVVSVSSGGREILRTSLPPVASGHAFVPVLARIALKPGQYDVEMTAQQDGDVAHASCALTIE